MALSDRIDALQQNLERRFLTLEGFSADGSARDDRFPRLTGRGPNAGGTPFPSLTGRYLGAEGFGGQGPAFPSLMGARAGVPFGALGVGAGPGAASGAPEWATQPAGATMRQDLFPHTKTADKTPGTGPTKASPGSTGMEPNVARWAQQTQDTFAGLVDPDVMLAIMTNESHGNPKAYNPNAPGGAWGLFQNVGLGDKSTDEQFAAARALAQEKVTAIAASYAANGRNPDERTRAMDFMLAWAGHFDYKTGKLNPNSRDAGSNQSASQLADIFFHNYDGIKAGKQAAPSGGPGGGVSGSMASVWGGGPANVNQDFGAVEPGIDQSIYDYGRTDYGTNGGHTGLDIGVKRGTQLYSPGNGTVTLAGGTGYFTDQDYGDDGYTPGKGELRLTMDDGTIIILGHTSAINVRVGDRVTAGQLVGLSGSASGDHLHLEVRVPDRALPSGYRIVDPRTYFGRTSGAGGAGQYTP